MAAVFHLTANICLKIGTFASCINVQHVYFSLVTRFNVSNFNILPIWSRDICMYATLYAFHYREFSVFAKEKGDIADALLSLKHAVVHQGMAPGPVSGSHQLSPLSPLSPTPLGHHHPGHQFHQTPSQPPPGPPPSQMTPGGSASSMGSPHAGPQPTFSYTVNHQPQVN